jgi:hypothetical protein
MPRRLHDDLPVFIGLATAIAIVIATVRGIWVWSSILERAPGETVERGVGPR